MQIEKQLELARARYSKLSRYLHLSDVQVKSVEDILDKLLENDQVASSGEYNHEYAYIQLLIECEFDYASDDPNKLIAAASSSDFVFDPEEGQWF